MAKTNWQCPNEWSEWSEWLAAGLHARNRWRLPVLLTGILFAVGRRTVSSWLRAAGVSADFRDYYYFLAPLGRKAGSVATQLFLLVLRTLPLPDRLLVVIDDSPTKRYGPKVEGADIHHNPTPGPADQKYLYGHIWVTLSLALRHPRWGALALPLRAMLYVREKTLSTIPSKRGWRFRTKLVLAACLVEWIARLVKQAGKTLWVVVDGGYTKAPFLKPAIAAGATVIGRLRKDAALRDLPRPLRRGQRRGRGRPRTYGKNRISLAKLRGTPARLANGRVHGIWKNSHQDLQDLSGHLRARWRGHSGGDCQGRARLVSLLLDRSECHGRGDYRRLCRPGHHRAGFPRFEGSVGRGPATSAEHLDQRGRLSSQSVDAYAGGTLGLEPHSQGTQRSQRLPMGRSRTPPISRGSPQSLTATHTTKRIINDHCHLFVAAKNPQAGPTPHGVGRLT